MNKTTPTSIRLPQELYERVADEAKEQKRSISSQIEYILEQYFKLIDSAKK